ncbi:MAG: response regulator [Desulfovibrionaceae bacterium]|nr:response regulator [Desulfovibrionaceae bacterium]MBF0514378.1 response regulator [Desulfovibrionaceae bacterium]
MQELAHVVHRPRVLIVDDDILSCKQLEKYFSPHAACDVRTDGRSAVEAFAQALAEGSPYGIVCIEIVMPGLDGSQSLELMRAIEDEYGVEEMDRSRVIITTGKNDPKSIFQAFFDQHVFAYLVKPIKKQTIETELKKLRLVE